LNLRLKTQNSKLRKLVPALLSWFEHNARDLPWRRTRDPYAIWISEIMLQQTQVKAVIPYWERWMRELPTIRSVAKAKPAKLHKLWEGLGYYTRVRNIQKTAKQIVEKHHGKFPKHFDEILALPGIGRYTAGAICSIAFNQPTPILDGNVIRVLTRIFGISSNPREKKTNAHLWQLAEELVGWAGVVHGRAELRLGPNFRDAQQRVPTSGDCSTFNQSLMELGALVCTPRSPNCAACPVSKLCVARKENLQDQLPNLGKRVTATERCFIAFVVERGGKFLVRQRPDGIVNAHLWEFPNAEVGRARSPLRAAMIICKDRRARSDAPYLNGQFKITGTKPLYTIKHSITRYRITLEAWHAVVGRSSAARPKNPGRRGTPPSELNGVWLRPAQLSKLAFPAAHRKILDRLVQMCH
jgi:A/G-specific adenine glycosylase